MLGQHIHNNNMERIFQLGLLIGGDNRINQQRRVADQHYCVTLVNPLKQVLSGFGHNVANIIVVDFAQQIRNIFLEFLDLHL